MHQLFQICRPSYSTFMLASKEKDGICLGLVERTEGVESIHGLPLYAEIVLIFACSKVYRVPQQQFIGDSGQLAYNFIMWELSHF
jgi:hypothetical protein